MPAIPPHWIHPADLAEAKRAQAEMAEAVLARDDTPAPRLIGGADISSQRFDPTRRVFAALVTLDTNGAPQAEATEAQNARFPYVPGYLGFREVPALVAAWQRLAVKPDVILVDGHGQAHPRGMGIATQLGVVLDVPTIGVAKSLLVGAPEGELPDEPGAEVPLVWKDRQLGIALRTRRRCNPLYVSVGHRVSLERAVAVVRATLGGRRLPAPIRAAHEAANALRRAVLAAGEAAG